MTPVNQDPPPPENHRHAAREEGPAVADPLPAKPVLLRDQPTPPEVQAALERYGRHHRLRGRAWAEAEEQLKLRFYYGGQSVIATPTPQGLLVHAVELADPDAVHALRQRLRGQGYRTVLSLYPRPWGESGPEVLTPTAVR